MLGSPRETGCARSADGLGKETKNKKKLLANQGPVDCLCVFAGQSEVMTDSVGKHLM